MDFINVAARDSNVGLADATTCHCLWFLYSVRAEECVGVVMNVMNTASFVNAAATVNGGV